jgi:biopolymer transport protein ExbB/TolQ
MNVIEWLDRGLFALGALLRGPVVLLLWACVLWGVGLFGAWLADSLGRRRQRAGFSLSRWTRAPVRDAAALPRTLKAFHAEAAVLQRDAAFHARLDECLTRHEEWAREGVAAARVLVKVGPSIGLLGTLIPMGGSLAALSQGNLEGMAGQMVAAFTSTIIGLAAGTLAFVVASRRQRWLEEDVRELRLVADLCSEVN